MGLQELSLLYQVLGRRNSAETKSTAVRQKQPVKIIDEGQAFCDTVLEYLTDNSDFLVIGEFTIVRCDSTDFSNHLHF